MDKAYLVVNPSWQYNDEYSYTEDGAVTPDSIFKKKKDAEEYLKTVIAREVEEVLNGTISLSECPDELQEMIDDDDKIDLALARKILQHEGHSFSYIVEMEVK